MGLSGGHYNGDERRPLMVWRAYINIGAEDSGDKKYECVENKPRRTTALIGALRASGKGTKVRGWLMENSKKFSEKETHEYSK